MAITPKEIFRRLRFKNMRDFLRIPKYGKHVTGTERRFQYVFIQIPDTVLIFMFAAARLPIDTHLHFVSGLFIT